MINSERLTMLPWTDDDIDDLEAMNLEPEVYELLGGPALARSSASALERYQDHFAATGWGVMRVEDHSGQFLGLAGLQVVKPLLPVAPAVEAVWRFRRIAWGHGYASEAIESILWALPADAYFDEVVALIAAANVRSANTASRIGFVKDHEADFMYPDESLTPMLRPHHVYRLSLRQFRP